MKKLYWLVWLALSASLIAYFVNGMVISDDKTDFLIGETTYGHYQIEMACTSCHTQPFGGQEILQDACTNCHADDLEEAHDSHPKSKFTDPREAHRIEIIDARFCISCHTEHREDQERSMGVTLPDDYCFHCHVDVVNERESHAGLEFDSCASAGCHNFHDNRALYEKFLVENANQPWLQAHAVLAPANNALSSWLKKNNLSAQPHKVAVVEPDSGRLPADAEIVRDWQHSKHAAAGINCSGCHNPPGDLDLTTQGEASSPAWIEKPAIAQCQRCHSDEAAGFLAGKHGMRLAITEPVGGQAAALTAITPKDSPLEFHDQSLNIQHGCNSCHVAHNYNPQFAAVDACLGCHNDAHSSSYRQSAHAKLWESEVNQLLPQGSGVSCATCHMPRIDAGVVGTTNAAITAKATAKANVKTKTNATVNDKSLALAGNSHAKQDSSARLVKVQHNQNWNLRPNEKMIRPVCMQCHSLEFSIDALADEKLVRANFNGMPSGHVESIDWALKRLEE